MTAYEEWSGACSELSDLAQAILDIPSTDSIGAGIRAAAALALDDDCENAFSMEDLLWELAARAGFTRPEEVDEAASHAAPPLDELVRS